MTDMNALKKEIQRLKILHRTLESQLKSLMCETVPDHVHIQRVKKQKLDTKDQIQALKNRLFPDIIA